MPNWNRNEPTLPELGPHKEQVTHLPKKVPNMRLPIRINPHNLLETRGLTHHKNSRQTQAQMCLFGWRRRFRLGMPDH